MNAQLLKKLFDQTPRMEPRDAIKFAHQTAYGCGHFLPPKDKCVEMITQEFSAVPAGEVPVYTPIGNGLCRLNLAAPQVRALDPELIFRMMQGTDRWVCERKDNDLRFTEAIDSIIALARKGEMPFSLEDFQTYWERYREERAHGSGVVSHTQAYHAAYQPSYRVVLENYALLVPVLVQMHRGKRLIVIDGPCGSGKTTLANALGDLFSTLPVPMDDFFLPPHMRTEARLSEPGGNVHRERFAAEVLASLEAGGPVRWQRFDCQTGQMLEREQRVDGPLIIEGSYSHHPAFAEAWKRLDALRVFITVDGAEQLRRLRKRNPEMLPMFQKRWIPLEKTYFEAYDIRRSADCVIDSPCSQDD